MSGCTSSMFRFRLKSTNDTLPTGATLSRRTNESVEVKCGGCSATHVPRPGAHPLMDVLLSCDREVYVASQ